MQILGYSERGFINSLLYEIAYREPDDTQRLLRGLFALVRWPYHSPEEKPLKKCGASSRCCTILVEQSFSQFGIADALLLFENVDHRIAVFCEGKGGEEYDVRRAWKAFIEAFRKQKGFKGLTSNLFCQLYFKQRLVRVLGPDSGENPGLTHHFSLGFLGFSWKIQEIHMIVRK